ncbi:hypothetical protein BJV78DRAFT_1126071 [Lactifluus subvellereus]|nr:hypothetical protein BJV78DRAFT_1126071 [Lactifluus subvellereus]
MPPSGPPTEQEVWNIARRTTSIIESNITESVCLFGSAACSLWSDIGRVPNDIDIVVSDLDGIWEEQELDAEEIKEKIVRADNRYFLEPSRQRGATHRLLYCRLPGWRTDGRRVKVDILVPPTLGLPEIHYMEASRIVDIPVMPIFDLLVMKTQGWWDHRTSERADFRRKESADVSDIFALLERAAEENVSYLDEADEYRHSQEFMDHALILVNRFVRNYGRHRQWRALEFPV